MTITTTTIEKIVPEEHRDLVFRFFLVFSRFEYALKRAGFTAGSSGNAKPGWDSFASKYPSAFNPAQTPELKVAFDYFSAHPPRKQVLDSGSLSWSAPQDRTREPILTWLLRVVRIVRNNLFHGGKFPIASIPDPARDPILLRHALTILGACVPIDAGVARHFATYQQ